MKITLSFLSLLACFCLFPVTASAQRDSESQAKLQEEKEQMIAQYKARMAQREATRKKQAAERAKRERNNPWQRKITVEKPLGDGSGATEPIEVYLYGWPNKAPESFEVFLNPMSEDNLPIPSLYLRGPDTAIRLGQLENWLLASEGYPQYGARFISRISENVELTATVFWMGSYLRGLETPEVQGYVEGLKQRYREKITLLNEWQYQPDYGFPILGGTWKEVNYQITQPSDSPDQPAVVITHRDYLVQAADRIFLFRFQAPEHLFEGYAAMVEKSLRHAIVLPESYAHTE